MGGVKEVFLFFFPPSERRRRRRRTGRVLLTLLPSARAIAAAAAAGVVGPSFGRLVGRSVCVPDSQALRRLSGRESERRKARGKSPERAVSRGLEASERSRLRRWRTS